ncbi:MAG TPA: M14 metallopeptidase family protein [Pyrinomonadaceae bacterium]|nr:M14 metallopeptidase family protein [Pyrinomonadaceae bacterium]
MPHFRFTLNFVLLFLLVLTCFIFPARAQTAPSPQSVLGFQPTQDKTIADWRQITDYFQKLDRASNRVKVEEIGKTTLGRSLIVAFISAPENIKNLEKHKRISQKLADPREIGNPAELENLIKNGKTIVSISCSIHSTEIVASQMSMNLAYELASARDADTLEILQNTILLLIPSSNPDGIDIVANWYRKNLGSKFEGASPPELYHHYAGHDNNRDWFMLNLKESQVITRFYWREWFPQIVYDVHQQGQNSSRFVIPPFFDPPNPRVSPLILREVGLIGYKMAADLQAKNIAGIATNSAYDTWWHGGFRSAPYYHNSIGILSEAASANLMSPITITEADLKRNRGTRGLASPLETATNFPVAWRGGLWRPSDIAELEMTASRALLEMAAKFRPRYLRNFYELGKANLEARTNEPQAFIIPAGQPNQETVSRFLEILMAQGMEIHRMTRELEMSLDANKQGDFGEIPLNSFVVFTNQPQRNNVLSLFEKQVYPQRLNANGEAEVPYDVAGWTLPLQMGVETVAARQIKDLGRHQNTLEKIANINEARQILNLAPNTEAFAKMPNPLKTNPRIGLYKGFTASMDEGWTRLVFDNFQIPYNSISDADFRGNNLNFDTIVLPSQSERDIVEGLRRENYPEQYTGGITEKGVENLRKFVENGGNLICFDDSCEMLIKRFNLPVKNVLNNLKRSEFYNPGSVVRLEVDTKNPLARNLKKETAAYFINSAAYEITDNSKVKPVAEYAEKDSLLSGWTLGEKYMNGKIALAQANYGKGKIVLFAFRPQHRGQTFGTFPFIFNALEK